MSTEHNQRLLNEARFQDQRVVAAHQGEVEARGKFYFLAQPAFRKYESAFGNVEGKRILVVGCSEGGVLPFARKGARVTGIDISPEAIASLDRRIEDEGLAHLADAYVMDAHDPEFDARTFDIICCTGVLHHLETERAIQAWKRILKSDGQVIMLEPMAWNPVVALYRILTPSMRTPDEHPLKPVDFRSMDRAFGSVVTHAYVLSSVLALGWLIVPDFWNIRRRTAAALGKLDGLLLRAVPSLKYFCWTAVIELRAPR